MRYSVAMALGLMMGGCSISKEERIEIVETVADIVQVKAMREVEAALIAEGIDPVQAKKVARIAIDKIDQLVRKALDKYR